ncbi:helix-turn-helix transcriptional regulator [Phytomonospora sp. NPDC050363]|uniref:helix-turn-helix domain-containing protein n=1 Tax=Phytomonospora sp. NPDC050363 TaxID=3155642 RepID=UPI0033E109CD
MLYFGPELRRIRQRARISLKALASMIKYSPGHLSKIETGRRDADVSFARLCESALDCPGQLEPLVPGAKVKKPPADSPTAAGEIWTMRLDPDGDDQFNTADESMAPDRPALWTIPPARWLGDDPTVLDGFRSMFDEVRRLGQKLPPSYLAPILVSTTTSLRRLASSATGPDFRAQSLRLGSRYAEYIGWIAQETGDDRAALWWTDQAVELASSAGDEEMTAYAYVRRALIAMYSYDATGTIDLALLARRYSRHPRVLGLAALREAQGHAIAGDQNSCHEALDRGARHMTEASSVISDQPVLGSSTVIDPVPIALGWCLQDLGKSRPAAEVLITELARIPQHAHRARARFGARLALALAGIRELEHACAILSEVLDAMEKVDSSTIRSDLRTLARELNRWHDTPCVREVMPRLTQALHPVRNSRRPDHRRR